jgi:hypothetical protein
MFGVINIKFLLFIHYIVHYKYIFRFVAVEAICKFLRATMTLSPCTDSEHIEPVAGH